MAICWRTELSFECDGYGPYGNGCSASLCLDQVDAPTKHKMFIVAKKDGWTWTKRGEKCWCPECTKRAVKNK